MIRMTDLNQSAAAFQSGGKPVQDGSLPSGAWERAVNALFEKLPEPEEEKKGFWSQRAESQEEFLELQQKAAARQRMLMKLRLNGGHISPAEVLMGLM